MSKNEPESIRDMEWAEDQKASLSVTVYHTNGSDEPSEGALYSIDTVVKANRIKDEVKIVDEATYYESRDEKGFWRLQVESEDVAILSFEEFKASEWWEPYLERTRGVNFDSSWMDSFEVSQDGSCVEAKFKMPEYKGVWWCSSEVPTGSTVDCSVYADSDGYLSLTVGEDSASASVGDFVNAVKTVCEFEKAGVSIDGDGNIVVKRRD